MSLKVKESKQGFRKYIKNWIYPAYSKRLQRMSRVKGRWKGAGRRIKVGSLYRNNNTVFPETQMQDFFMDLELRACMTLNWQYSGFPGRYGYLRLIHKGRQKHTDIFTKADETSLYLQGKTTKLNKNWDASEGNIWHTNYLLYSPQRKEKTVT